MPALRERRRSDGLCRREQPETLDDDQLVLGQRASGALADLLPELLVSSAPGGDVSESFAFGLGDLIGDRHDAGHRAVPVHQPMRRDPGSEQMPESYSDHMSSKDLSIHIGHEELVIRGRYETVSIINDLLIAVWFIIGSALFFSTSTTTAGTWLFLVGSIQLLIRPAIRLARRIHITRIGPGAAETARDF